MTVGDKHPRIRVLDASGGVSGESGIRGLAVTVNLGALSMDTTRSEFETGSDSCSMANGLRSPAPEAVVASKADLRAISDSGRTVDRADARRLGLSFTTFPDSPLACHASALLASRS